jgi:hypothetical protein
MRRIAPQILFAFCLLLLSCSQPDYVLPRRDGNWKVNELVYEEYHDYQIKVSHTDTTALFYNFGKDGSCTLIYTHDTIHQTWSVDRKEDLVTICNSLPTGSSCADWTVGWSSSKLQQWSIKDTTSTPGDYYIIFMELERMK